MKRINLNTYLGGILSYTFNMEGESLMNRLLEVTNLDKFIALTPLMRLGNNRKRRDEMMVYFRHIVLKMLHDEGILSTFEKPITIEDAAKKSGWQYPSEYVEDFVTILVNDKVLKRTGGISGNEYALSPSFKPATKEPLVHHFEDFDVTYAEYVKNIPPRLKGESQDFTGQISLFNWDSALASQLYQVVRDSAFAFIDMKWLRNAKILDVGCGPGYETADMWVKLANLNVEITAIEPDEGLIKIAEGDFTRNVKKAGLDIDRGSKDVPRCLRFTKERWRNWNSMITHSMPCTSRIFSIGPPTLLPP